VLVLAAAALGGCLTDAQDKSYKFNNPKDTTPAGGSGDTGAMAIALVDDEHDVVVISNQTVTDQDLDGWTLEDDNSDAAKREVYPFPVLTLKAGAFVRVWTIVGTDGPSDLYFNDNYNWGLGVEGQTANLYDNSHTSVDSCSIDDLCWP
jgi:hypothetical protein